MADGSITFSTALDNEQLEKDLKRAERQMDSLRNKLEQTQDKKSFIEAQIDSAQEAIRKTKAEIDELKAKLEDLKNTPPEDAAAWHAAQGQMGGVQSAIDAALQKLEQQRATVEKLDGQWQKLDEQAAGYGHELESATKRADSLATELGKGTTAAQKLGAAAKASASGAAAALDQFASRIGGLLKRVFVFNIILQGIRAVRDAVGSALKQNEAYAASFNGLQAVASGFAAGIANAVAPILISAIRGVIAVLTTLASIIDRIFGTRIVAAIEAAKASAGAATAAAGALSKQAKATKKLAAEQKKATKTLLAFDELNQMQSDNAEDVADSLGGGGDGGGGGAGGADLGALDVSPMSDKLAEIMLILGAALMAVGAILCFSGINIPLGISLMVIGALMIYTVYQENWDALPESVRNAITGLLVFTGVALIAIGAVLAFSGVNLPLGIGLMVAGALLLWTAVALNWASMSTQVQTVITTIMTILSAALLAVGVMLTLSGANMPLGIALMAVGAASLAGVVALNWGSMSTRVKSIVTNIMQVLGAALLAIGAILALSGVNLPLGLGLLAVGAVTLAAELALNWDTLPNAIEDTIRVITLVTSVAMLAVGAVLAFSGANLPLGIALLVAGALGLTHSVVLGWDKLPSNIRNTLAIIEGVVGPALLAVGAILALSGANLPLGIALIGAGALVLAHLATINWDTMPESVRSSVSAIMGIIGASLIVIGIILVFTGVGIPLGVALIAAGAASLITAAAVNWNFLKDKLAEVWQGIRNYWDTHIAPYFTFSFWADLAKGAMNGLISALNSGLSGVGWFLNSLLDGVSWVLSCFGVGWSGSISMPQIPYLAQGAVIPPNREFLAVLGDQTSGTNIEAPEALLRQVVREEAGAMIADAMLALSGNAENAGDVVLEVDATELARAAIPGLRSLASTGEVGGLSIAFT